VSKNSNRFKRRVTVLCMAALAAVLAAIHTAVYFTGKRDVEAQLMESAKGIAASVASCLMLDAGEYGAFLDSMDAGSPYYGRMQGYLASVKASSDIVYVYTERRIDALTSEFVLDGEPVGAAGYSPPGQRETLDVGRNGEAIALKERIYSSKAPEGYRSTEFGRWGRLLGAYAPILGEDGEAMGLVGVDMDGSHLYGHLRRVNGALMLIDALIMSIALASLLGFSDALMDRLFKDKLTGAYTKRYFEGLLSDEIAHSLKHGSGMALLMADLDHFKSVNDTYGHVFGDTVLASVSETIRGAIRPSDYFVRYGGEEFAVIMPNADPRGVMDIAERMRAAVEGAPIFNESANEQVRITISVGVAIFGYLSQNPGGLVENADKALYQAKIRRNMVAMFEQSVSEAGGRNKADG
jgi:diguanylate cyclase (GGDEF)-like protein